MPKGKRINLYYSKYSSFISQQISFPDTYEELIKIISMIFKLSQSELPNLTITYLDDEWDKVTISNTYDLQQSKLFASKEELDVLRMDLNIGVNENQYDSYYDEVVNITTQSIIRKLTEEKLDELETKMLGVNIFDDKSQYSPGDNKKIEQLLSKLFRSSGYFKVLKKPKVKTCFLTKIYKKENSHEILKESQLSNISNEKYSFINNILQQIFEKIKNKMIKKMLKKTYKNFKNNSISEESKLLVKHAGIKCEECDEFPIHGIRYKCSICSDYNICEVCETSINHYNGEHPFIKIRNPNVLKNIQFKFNKLVFPEKDDELYLILCKKLKESYDLKDIPDCKIVECLKQSGGDIDKTIELIFI